MVKLKRLLGYEFGSYAKQSVAILATFLIIAGTHAVLHTLLEGTHSAISHLFALFVVLMLTFLIVELNRKLPGNSAAIGLVLALPYVLAFLIGHAYFGLSASVAQWFALGNLITLPLASYVFETLWSQHTHLQQSIRKNSQDDYKFFK